MLGTILKTGYKYVNFCLKSYGIAKYAEKTGMSIPDFILYKESLQCCSQYYSNEISIFLKELVQKSKVK